ITGSSKSSKPKVWLSILAAVVFPAPMLPAMATKSLAFGNLARRLRLVTFLAGSGVAFSTRVLRAARVRRDEAGFVSSTSFRGASGGGAAEPRDEPVFFAEEATEATLEAELRAPLRGADDGGLRGVRAVM